MPEEALQDAYETKGETVLPRNFSTQVHAGESPTFFELLVRRCAGEPQAWGTAGSRKDAGEAIGQVADPEGIDGIIKEDRLGLDIIYIQSQAVEGHW